MCLKNEMKRNRGQSLREKNTTLLLRLNSTWCWKDWQAVSHSDAVAWGSAAFNCYLPNIKGEGYKRKGKGEASPEAVCPLFKCGYHTMFILFFLWTVIYLPNHMMTKLCIISSSQTENSSCCRIWTVVSPVVGLTLGVCLQHSLFVTLTSHLLKT